MRQWFIAAAILLSVYTTGLAAAEPVGFAEARAIILRANGAVRAAAAEIEAARSGILQTAAIPNPVVSLELERFGANEIEATVGQTFELGRKRAARQAVSQVEVRASTEARSLSVLELETEIVRRFLPIALASEKIHLLDSVISITERTRSQIAERIDAGAGKRIDLLRVEMELDELCGERAQLERELETARGRFAVLAGDSSSALLNVSGHINDASPVPSADSLCSALSSTPAMQSFSTDSVRLAAELALAQAELTPDLEVSAGYIRNNEDGTGAPMTGLSFEIPLFTRRTSLKNQSVLRHQALQYQKENQFRELSSQTREIHSKILEIDRRLQLYRSKLTPKASEVRSVILEHYQAGKASFLELMEAQSELQRLRMKELETAQERAEALADLMQLTGVHFTIVE